MTSPPIFPVLAGQGWSVHKKPTFATIVAPHVSAREVRSPQYLNPIWNFELTFDGLDGTTTGQYGGLGAQSLQTLMGLFLQCQGQYSPFLFYDPTDYTESAQQFGTGDGTTTSFALVRSMGAFLEPIVAPVTPSAPTLFQVQGSAAAYLPNNLIANSANLAASTWAKHNVTVTTGVADPFGGTSAVTLTSTGSSTYDYETSAAATLPNYVNSIWARRRTGSGVATLSNPANAAWVNMTANGLGATWQRFSYAGAPNGSNVATLSLGILTSGDAIDVYGPQLEASLATTPGAFTPTLATPYYGGPFITANGALVDPSAYTIANGVVTFAAAPASGAALAWTGYFGFLCRFDGDDLDFEQFMANLWKAQSVKFRSLRGQ